MPELAESSGLDIGSRSTRAPGLALAVVSVGASELGVKRLVESLRAKGIRASFFDVCSGVLMIDDVSADELHDLIESSPELERSFVPVARYRLVDRQVAPLGSVVNIGSVAFGAQQFVVVAGPCAVESRNQLIAAARSVTASGAAVLRGGAFKPRTDPYEFQGLGMHGVELLAEARRVTGLPFVTEVMDPSLIEPMCGLVDGFQVGARNMQNYDLLKALASVDKPVLLKRGAGATVEEWLLSAEYLLKGGNGRVVLCERGIRTFNSNTRFTLDLAGIAYAKRETHLPVIADPSHATGRPDLVAPMARAALAAGADGVMVEVHPDPEAALSDGFQALSPTAFDELVRSLEPLASSLGRPLARPFPTPAEPAAPALDTRG